ncbi:MAG: hypothetical protein JNL58_06195 [Planctomyces sp.]|nr:hypothetical protein [Planctomyces sp.]
MSGSRKQQLISRKIQIPIVVRVVVHLFAYNAAVLCLLVIAWGVRNSWAMLSDHVQPAGPTTFQDHAIPVLFCMLAMTPVMVWDLIRLTNRVAGPIHRFETLLDRFIATGKLDQAKLRDDDLLMEFQDKFNEFTEALHALYPETCPDRLESGVNSISVPTGQRHTTQATASPNSQILQKN